MYLDGSWVGLGWIWGVSDVDLGWVLGVPVCILGGLWVYLGVSWVSHAGDAELTKNCRTSIEIYRKSIKNLSKIY